MHLSDLLRYYPKIHDALRQFLVYLESQRIVIPSYRTLQDIFTQAFAHETNRLNQKMSDLPQHQKEQLSALFNAKMVSQNSISFVQIKKIFNIRHSMKKWNKASGNS